jgi:flagellar motility protein MotE (MotC chaperone)
MNAKNGNRRRWTGAGAAGIACGILLLCLFPFICSAAQDDIAKFLEAKNLELKQREQNLQREEERLNALRKDVEAKIAAYNKLLADVDVSLKKMDTAKGEKLDTVVKAYEIMGAEDAAARLSALDEPTALRILSRMKSKKAGAVIAAMPPRKAASLTRRMTYSASDKPATPAR